MWFDLFRVGGEVLEPVGNLMAADWKERFSARNLALFKGRFSDGAYHDVIQVQAFVVSDVPLEGERRATVLREYEAFREQVFTKLESAWNEGGQEQ